MNYKMNSYCERLLFEDIRRYPDQLQLKEI